MAKTRTPSVWETAEELPRAGTADTIRMERHVRLLRRYAVASMFLLPFTFVAALLLISQAGTRTGTTVATDNGQEAVATAAVVRWLDGTPAPLPGGRLLTWDGQTVVGTTAADESSGTPATRLEEHTLTVLTGTGVRMQVQVLVRVAGQDVQVAGAPSLQAVVPEQSSDPDVTNQWPGTDPASPSSDVQLAITSWAKSYVSGDPAALRQQVGDPDPSHAYLPLSGLTAGKATIGAGAWLTTKSGNNVTRTGYMVVRLSLPLTWDGQAKGATTDYDLLVADASTAAPRVVAWGGPGTGPGLSPYSNAIDGVQVQQDSSAGLVPTGSPTVGAQG